MPSEQIDVADLLESVNSPTPSIEAIFDVLFTRRFTGTLPLILHFRGGKVQVLEVLHSTQIRLHEPHEVDKGNGT